MRIQHSFLRGMVLALVIVFAIGSLWRLGISIPVLTDVPVEMPGDAQNYLAAATSLVDRGALIGASQQPLTLFPPGFPMLIAIPLLVGIPVFESIFLINAVSIVIIILLTFQIGIRVLGNQWLAVVAAALVGVNPSVLKTASLVLSELPFAAIAMAVFLLAVVVTQNRSISRIQFLAFIALIWIGISIKLIGVALVVPFAFALLHTLAGRSRRQQWTRLIASCGLALFVLVPIIVRNIALGSGIFGDRRQAYITPEGAVSSGLEVLGRIVVQPDSSGLSGTIGVLLAAAFLGAIWLAWLNRDRGVQVLGLGVAAYFAVLWISQTRTHVDADIERFLIPVLGAVVVVLIYLVIRLRDVSRSTLLQRGQVGLGTALDLGLIAVIIFIIGMNLLKSVLVTMSFSVG